MGLNFPSAPLVGEIYPTPAQPGVPQWKWNGTSWKALNVDTSSYVLKSGDTISGDLAVQGNLSVQGKLIGGTALNIGSNALPTVTGTLNLGSATFRWGTVYTSDLSLSNGIGDWTIVEGEDDLFIYNNKRGKVYKFALYEVAPVTAPPKKA